MAGSERVGLELTGELNRGEFGMAFNQVLGSRAIMLVSDKVKLGLRRLGDPAGLTGRGLVAAQVGATTAKEGKQDDGARHLHLRGADARTRARAGRSARPSACAT